MEDGFYIWNIDVKNKINYIKLAAILIGVFLICLFPIWPFSFKYGIFKLTLYLLIFLIGLQVIRLLLYSVIRLFGMNFGFYQIQMMILMEFQDHFFLFITAEKIEIVLRFIVTIAFFALIFLIVQEPHHLNNFSDAKGQTLDDILILGKEKMEAKQEPLHRRAIPNLSELIKQAEEDLKMLKRRFKMKIWEQWKYKMICEYLINFDNRL